MLGFTLTRRRKHPSFGVSTFISVALLVTILAYLLVEPSHQGPIVGIDLGSRWLKVGIAKSGSPIDLVLNEQSKRKTSNIIGFRGQDRYIGEAGYTMVARFPDKMLRFLNFVLGKSYDLELKQTWSRYNELKVPVTLVKNDARGTVDVKFSNDVIYSPEELLSMIFLYIKQLADDGKSAAVTDAIVSIPHFFTKLQRQAILDAAAIANIKILALMHDHTATALQYGIKSAKTIKELTKPRHVALFYDIGSVSTTVSVAEYTQSKEKTSLGNIKVLGFASDENLGGVHFDNVLADYFAEKFIEKYKADPRKEVRPVTRLVEESQKIKQILSANNDAYLSIENLYNDRDLSLRITREEFEKLSEPLLNRLAKPITAALAMANLTLDDIDAFEMSGGSSRIPAVQDRISKFVGSKLTLGYSLNADEAIAMGSSFYGAMLSPSFKVTAFKIVDIVPHKVDFLLSGNDKEMNLFNHKDEIDAKKTITVPRTDDFTITLKYAPEYLPSGFAAEHATFATYEITGVGKAMSNWTFEDERGKKKKVKATFKVNKFGLPELDSVNAILEETITVRVDNANDTKNGNETAKAEPVYKKDTRVTKVALDVKLIDNSVIKPLTPEQLKASQEKVKQVEDFEALKRRISAARNNLESALYSTREKLLENVDYKGFFTLKEKDDINSVIDELEVWLSENDDEGIVEPSRVDLFKSKLKTLTDLTDPIQDRLREHKGRKEALKYCKSVFNATSYTIHYMREHQKHITEEELSELNQFNKETEMNITTILAKQDRTPLYEPPTILAADIKKQCTRVSERAFLLSKKPVPKPEKSAANETTIPATNEETKTEESSTADSQEQSERTTEEQKKKDEL
ncbi:hypothetical protein C9374_009191 [Naegleria lovaniensis]|uniref:Uncharacterized protein n=1 Tax=Naegleria lovaniensis TaxID=51637 RepID=A0AA88GJ03_NAELO|nr:uncharacterized protein C9374_009191 [Naegleria lovaniensis]KAG2377675.1 hypothetical protein C9374_009191 [Naegleria lovaniensis]